MADKKINDTVSDIITEDQVSLALNWFNEINKFAPTLKTTVIAGNAEERKRLIQKLTETTMKYIIGL